MRAGFGVRAALILIGFTAAVGQIVLLREMMVVFGGTEISLGVVLAGWLFWTAAGSRLSGRVSSQRPRAWMAAIQAALACVLPATILGVRAAKGLLQTVPGEVLGPGPMLFTSLVLLAPLCALSGALFTVGARVVGTGAAEAGSSVYLWEAVGSATGGMAAGGLLALHLGSLEIAVLPAVLNLMAASRRRWAGAILAVAAALAYWIGTPRAWETASQTRFWRGQQFVAARNSVYGSLAVIGAAGSRTVYESGVALCNVPDPPAAEEAVHYALLEHPAPRRLLLIGGGINGSVAEALRHPSLERVDYVELDPALLDLARRYFPETWQTLANDPRVRVHAADGRLFLNTTPTTFDVAIVNLPGPRNAQLNRFFTAEFFREAAQKLEPGGVLSFQVRASENYISPELALFLRSIHATLRLVFPEVATIPGETVHFFGAKRAGVLASGADELVERLRSRGIRTSFVSEYFIPYRMAPDRVADLDAQLRGPAPINRDFAPVAYYFDIVLWSSQFHSAYRRLFRALASVPFAVLAFGSGALLLALMVAVRTTRREWAAGLGTATTGFTMIGLEVLLLLAFQALYGYVYQQLAVLIAAFMAGMAMGSGIALRRQTPPGKRALALALLLVAAAPLALLGLLHAIGRASLPAFPMMALASGILGGFQFAVAGRIFFAGGKARHPGTLYALDLAGSCGGAILFSAWLVPVFGFFRTAVLASLVSSMPACLAVLESAAGSRRAAGRRTPAR